MITDQDYNALANDVYDVDTGKVDNSIKNGRLVARDKYKVLEAEDNPDNGMQAMVVGAIKGGEVGKSHIMIVYVKSSYLLAS